MGRNNGLNKKTRALGECFLYDFTTTTPPLGGRGGLRRYQSLPLHSMRAKIAQCATFDIG
jgi:hypothetical protein